MNGAAAVSERKLAEGIFGIVTTKRIICRRDRGWMGDAYRTDIALARLSSVSLSIRRQVLGALLLTVLAIGAAAAYRAGAQEAAWLGAIAINCGIYAILMFWGSPIVSINASSVDTVTIASAWPWHRQEAEQFVEAIRQVILNR
jgi:hypothetical protein